MNHGYMPLRISHLINLKISNEIIFKKNTNIRFVLQIIDVVMIAAIVPRGILRLGSRKSPLRFDPAMMPEKIIFSLNMRKEFFFRTSD